MITNVLPPFYGSQCSLIINSLAFLKMQLTSVALGQCLVTVQLQLLFKISYKQI